MSKKLSITHYRKIKNIDFDFSQHVNLISGTNGTCKTSLLHLISNSFQAVTKTCNWVTDNTCLEVIKKINTVVNPKVETLTKGDKKYNDPANGTKGALFEMEYFDRESLNFRRHNSTIANRYSVKPKYKPKSGDSLPFCPVIYLGLSRLFSFGEFQDDNAIKSIKKGLPASYQSEVAEIYQKFTGISITTPSAQKMGEIKIRSEFSSASEGIDSNTISAGEDNLFILITALVSLKYYYESINSTKIIESILLIDELDATLHPSLQIKFLNLLDEYSQTYKIQVFFTTHSLSLLEEALQKKHNVIYLVDNVTSVVKLDTPDIYKIKMHLHSLTQNDIYLNKSIPVFTEDEEARMFLRILFDFYSEKNRESFAKVQSFFHFINANIGSRNLINIFEDTYLLKSTMRSICILDGDQSAQKDLTKGVITLPGNASPEKLIMDYALYLYESDDSFWTQQILFNLGYTKIHFRDNIRPDILSIDAHIQSLEEEEKSTKGVRRELNKRVFNKHKQFFDLLFKYWINSPSNMAMVNSFYNDLYSMFKKVSEFHGISSKEWIM